MRHLFFVVPLLLALGCSKHSTYYGDGGAPDASTSGDGAQPWDAASASSSDLAGGVDLAAALDLTSSGNSGDGTPTRQQCTSQYGTQLSAEHGRLDGYLVSIIPPTNGSQCNEDTSHVHLQVSMNGGIYDVAIDIGRSGDEIWYLTKDLAMPDGAWSEGWHTSDAATTVENALAQVNHISVFGTGYNSNGMHLIHYQSGKDGAIVVDPLSATSHLLLFRFTADTF